MENIDLKLSDNLDIDKSVSIEEYISNVVSLAEQILESRFPNDKVKQQIKVHRDRINFACPYCGDSMQSSHKKRGNIILEGKHRNFYKCFNCGEFTRVDKFFKDYNIRLDLGIINYIGDNLGNFSTSFSSKHDISLLFNTKDIEKYSINREDLKKTFNLIEAKDSNIWKWLVKRHQYQHENFLFNIEKNYLLILNLTSEGNIIGGQKRMFYGTNKYITVKASTLHKTLKTGIEVPDNIDLISPLFGILNINFNLPITVFEGALDSFFFKNSIANSGLQKSFPLDIPVRYWFDYDSEGNKKAIEFLERGEKVFLWGKFLNDINAPYRKKWDLNDVIIWAKNNNINLPNFNNYFSNDYLDMIDL